MSELTSRVCVVLGDITELNVDVLVTAANAQLAGGGGVDGAVHRAAGPELVVASRALAPCPTGQARMTPGFRLRAAHVIHAVGPIYQDGQSGEARALRSAYRSSLELAHAHRLETIAFPCISTGVYGYPKEEAMRTAIDTVLGWLGENELPKMVTFCCFDPTDERRYREQLKSITND